MGMLERLKNYLSVPKIPKSDPFPQYVVIDTETTGFSPSADRFTELGAIKVQNGEIVETFSTLVNPGIGISKEVEDITHITNTMVADAPHIEQVLPPFIDFINNQLLVGHYVPFDLRFLGVHCRDMGIPFTYQYVDTLTLCRVLLPQSEGYQSHRLRDMCRYFGIKDIQYHRALQDCYATNGDARWHAGEYGGKIKRAMELREKGNPIAFASEVDIFGK